MNPSELPQQPLEPETPKPIEPIETPSTMQPPFPNQQSTTPQQPVEQSSQKKKSHLLAIIIATSLAIIILLIAGTVGYFVLSGKKQDSDTRKNFDIVANSFRAPDKCSEDKRDFIGWGYSIDVAANLSISYKCKDIRNSEIYDNLSQQFSKLGYREVNKGLASFTYSTIGTNIECFYKWPNNSPTHEEFVNLQNQITDSYSCRIM